MFHYNRTCNMIQQLQRLFCLLIFVSNESVCFHLGEQKTWGPTATHSLQESELPLKGPVLKENVVKKLA